MISAVADVIGAELDRAKARIAKGRDQMQAEVRKLPADLQAVGRKAAGDFSAEFDELTESVDAKGSELVQTLASRYNDALKAVDAEIAAEKEKNKGLVAKAVGAIKGVIDTIRKLKDMLTGVLAKAASAVKAILKDPIGFLGRLISAVGAGLEAFMARIGEHLKKGLLGWLLGAMAAAGVTLPDKFDLKGLIVMIGSMLGLTWMAIRGRVTRKGVPEPAMAAVEKSVPAAQKLQSEGVGGIWEDIKAKVGDLKESLFSKISRYLIPTVLIAGITWILSLLNPASAFIKACKMIVDIVMFIVTQGAQIVQFVNAVLDAVVAIATGGGGGVPGLIEGALSKSIPVLIGALAAILGIGGVAAKVQKFFRALARPVGKAVDWVVDKIARLGRKLWAKLKAKLGRKGRKARDGRRRGDLAGGMRAAHALLRRGQPAPDVERQLPGIKARHRLATLELVIDRREGSYDYAHAEGTVQRASTPTAKLPNPSKPPPKVAVGDPVEVKWGNRWAICEVSALQGTDYFTYFGHLHSGPVSGTVRKDQFGKTWRDYKPGRTYKVGKAFDAIKDLSSWATYADASQVLSWRAHGRFNVPPGKNWHHIHERSAGGANSVDNLGLVDWRINQVDFKNWFGRAQAGTGGMPLRRFLRSAGPDVHLEWGIRCLKAHGLKVVMRDEGRGPYQEIV